MCKFRGLILDNAGFSMAETTGLLLEGPNISHGLIIHQDAAGIRG